MRVYKYLLSKQWFYNVSGPFLEIKSANMHKKTLSYSKYPKSFLCLRKMCLMVWKRTFYGNVDLSTTCQCRQLKLNPLSMQINIYCLMTNQTPALLVQRSPWRWAAVMLLQSLYFSCPPPPPRAIIPNPVPSVHLKIKIAVSVRRGISKRSHEKIGHCEQFLYQNSFYWCPTLNRFL